MKDFLKNKLITGMVVVATLILAGVAVFTATRLYQLRKQAVAPNVPESEPLAWDCSKYKFLIEGSGVIKVMNDSIRDEPAQQARVYINDQLVATLDVPALSKGQSATIGTIAVPQGNFSWRITGTQDSSSSGNTTSGPISCSLLTFSLTQASPTPTTPGATNTPVPTATSTPVPSSTTVPSSTPVPTNSPTPTDLPRGGGETPVPTQPAPTTVAQNTVVPTTSYIAAASPTPGGDNLPAAGVSTPTVAAIFAGLFIIFISLALAI